MRFCPRCGTRYEHERFCPEDGASTEVLPGAAPARDALIGTVVDGRYRIDEQIGEGGMGVVYKALHVSLNKTLALKVLRGEMAKDPDVVRRFIQEAQAATSIGHENIIDISDFGRLPDGTVYFVMEYLDGRPLKALVERGGAIPMADAVSIIRQICSALGAAHLRGIVHRDLKPDNIHVITRGEQSTYVKVLDFGIAKVGGASNKLTQTGMVFGTPHYMSPEQAAGQSVDARTDIYALGVIMYEMFTGRVPFDADTFMGVLTKHMFEKPAPMNVPGASKLLGAIEQITLRALEKKPEHRYQSMDELTVDLDEVVGGGSVKVTPHMRNKEALADALEPRTRSEMNLERRSRVSPKPGPPWRWVGVGVAIGALILGGVVYAILRSERENVARAVPPVVAPVVGRPPEAGSSSQGASAAQPGPVRPGPDAEAIRVVSYPSGAALVIDGAILGYTPAQFPRPTSGTRQLELRLEGYITEAVHIAADSPTELRQQLRPKPALPVARAKPASSPVVEAPKPVAPQPKPAAPRSARPRNTEVLDPWE